MRLFVCLLGVYSFCLTMGRSGTQSFGFPWTSELARILITPMYILYIHELLNILCYQTEMYRHTRQEH